MTSYGYVGLGQMGSAMAHRLIDTGATVIVHDLEPDRVAEAVELGASAAGSSAEVAEVSDIVSVCVPAAPHIEVVLHGPDSIGSVGREGQIVLIHSTVLPETVQEARDRVAEWGGSVFDACIAGGAEAARAGDSLILAGGVTDMPRAVSDLLEIYGSRVIDGGPIGGGAALKIAFNIMTYAQFAAAAAAFDVLGHAAADTAALVEGWRHLGQLGSLTESYLGLLAIPPEQIEGEFREQLLSTVGIAEKDLELAAELSTTDSERHRFVEALKAAMAETFKIR